MNAKRWKITGVICLIGLLVLGLRLAPRNPVAIIQVMDSAGKPIRGAVIAPDGLRPKSGPYENGHYSWASERNGVRNTPVHTDERGLARIPYPKYVFERIETGQISFAITHPDFVPDRPFRTVAMAPPARAPWRAWVDYALGRLRYGLVLVRPEPVVLRRGAVLIVRANPQSDLALREPLFVQAVRLTPSDTNCWFTLEPGVTATRRLEPGPQSIRAIQLDPSGRTWFSDVVRLTAVEGLTNDITVELRPGVTLRGRLDSDVPRPVRNGRVVVHIWPTGHKAGDSPAEWHAWALIQNDGSFEVPCLPAGELEVVALSQGFVSRNGPGQFQMIYPQKHRLGTNDLDITVGMEPTAQLEVQVVDDKGNPLEGAHVATWPNVRYGEWSATILLSDCHNTADWLRSGQWDQSEDWLRASSFFEADSDHAGRAVLLNLPSIVSEFAVEHPRFVLPMINGSNGEHRREATVVLAVGVTNRVSVKLVPRDQAPISHF